jgi:phosphoribosylformylglycinamidine cyclo-ligase
VTDPAERMTYAGAGVSLDAAEEVVGRIRAAVASTQTREVMAELGGFAGLYAPRTFDPVLSAACDGVGTKIALAVPAGRLHAIGVDCVAMSVNDVVTAGGRPAFFLDYVSCGRLVPDRIAALVEGVAAGCREAGCALLGGETAEHPGLMAPDDIDVAGFCVAVGERRDLVTGARIAHGDAVVGVAASGPHANGFSLIRGLLERAGVALDERPDALGGASVTDALLEPTRIYARAARALTDVIDVHGMAHITGGGIPGNIGRPLPAGAAVEIDMASWTRPPVFDWIASLGVAEEEMSRVFNLGLGFAAYVPAGDADRAITALERAGYPAWRAGTVVSGEGVTLSWPPRG